MIMVAVCVVGRHCIALDTIGCTVANLENLSMQVKNSFLSVEKMLICSISPTYGGIGVTPSSCF